VGESPAATINRQPAADNNNNNDNDRNRNRNHNHNHNRWTEMHRVLHCGLRM